jgi:hypothetical protein
MELGEFGQDMKIADRRQFQAEMQRRGEKLAKEVTNSANDPINALFERSWFHRMWTIQEVTLSLFHTIVVWCGDLKMPWPYLILAIDVLKRVEYRWGRWRDAMSLQQQLTTYLAAKRNTTAKKMIDDNPGNLHNGPREGESLRRPQR